MNQPYGLSLANSRWSGIFRRSLLLWNKPFYAGISTALVFLGIASLVGVPWRSTGTAYYNYLADAFLHGQLFLRSVPQVTVDLSLFNGKYYLYWGPLPAIIAMPLVALFGVQASDILQCIAFGSINVGIFSLLLQKLTDRGFIQLTSEKRAFLVIFFSMGTMQAPLLPLGSVWYLGQVESVTFALLAFLAIFSLKGWKAFFWTGCAVAGILATRTSAVFVTIFLAWYLLRSNWALGIRKIIHYCLIGLAPCLLALGLLLTYNLLRFGNALENGLSYHLMGPSFVEMANQYGIFSIHYIPINLYYDYIYYPLSTLVNGVVTPLGGSLFLLSPLFLAALFSLWQDRRDLDTWLLFASVIAGNFPALLVMAPGSIHFGPRYLLDIVVPLLLLTARGMRKWSSMWVFLLVGLSVLQYIFGSLGMVYTTIAYLSN